MSTTVASPQIQPEGAGLQRALEVLRERVADTPANHEDLIDLVEFGGRHKLSREDLHRAVAVLCQESLIERDEGDHVRIRSVSDAAAIEFYRVRTTIESLISAEAARTVRGTALYDLWDVVLRQGKVLERIKATPEIEEADRKEFTRLAASFHVALADAVGFQFAARLIKAWMPRMRSLGLASLEDVSRMEAIVREHAAILEAINRGDEIRVRAAMESHMEHNISRLKHDR